MTRAEKNPDKKTQKSSKLRQRLNNEIRRSSLDHCVKCTICETACPVAGVTALYGGPKYSGPQAERYREGTSVDSSIDYCSSCGTCTLVCPQGVQVSEIISLAKAIQKSENGVALRDRLITQTILMGKTMTPLAPLANAALANKTLRKIIEEVIGIASEAPMPVAQRQTLRGWLASRPKPVKSEGERIVFFHGCAGGYFEVEAAKAGIEVLEYLGFDVVVPPQGCCGLAQQSNGLYDQATKSVRKLAQALDIDDAPIVSTSGSCIGMIKHEARDYLGLKNERINEIGARAWDISEFLMAKYDAGQIDFSFNELTMSVPYHQPCQVRSQAMGSPAVDLLRLIPGLKVIESKQSCCGIAGTYGLKKEKFQVAQKVGEPLFEMIRESDSPIAICDTETCRWQIQKGSGKKTIHPIQLVHLALGLNSGN